MAFKGGDGDHMKGSKQMRTMDQFNAWSNPFGLT
jgi:hypothetical protein